MVVVLVLAFAASTVASAAAKVNITTWTFFKPWALNWEKTFKAYQKDNPNVSYEVLEIPWGEYWNKLTAGIPAGQGPVIYNMHAVFLTPHVVGGFAAPWPGDMFPMDKIKNEFPVSRWFVYKGNFYTIPIGIGSFQMYYNTDLWKEAGQAMPTLESWPKTWDETINIAKKLTKTDSSGNIVQAGYGENGHLYWLYTQLLVQQGRWIFDADVKKTMARTPEAEKAIGFINDLYDKHKVNSRDFLPFLEGMGAGKTGMVSSWTWLSDWLLLNHPNTKWDVFPLPTLTGKPTPAWSFNLAVEPFPMVNNRASAEEKRVAFNILKKLYFDDNEDFVDWAYHSGYVPTKGSLQKHPRILERKQNSITAMMADYVIPLPEQPSVITEAEGGLQGDIIARRPVKESLERFAKAADAELAKANYIFLKLMRDYKYASQMLPDPK
jgi:ABC-type glycerol-3-phosphate transport system substrate-binding protein